MIAEVHNLSKANVDVFRNVFEISLYFEPLLENKLISYIATIALSLQPFPNEIVLAWVFEHEPSLS